MASAIKTDLEDDGNAELMAELVIRLFGVRTGAHIQHLRSRSFAEHMILNDLYSEIGDKADAICEAWQGTYQELLPLTTTKVPEYDNGDPLDSLKVTREWIDENRDECCDDEEIQALIDEAMMLIDSSLYKLKFLK